MADEERGPLEDQDGPMMTLIEFARAWGYRTYAEALNALIAGEIPARRIRGRWYVTRTDADRLLLHRHGGAPR
ncbi:hypothetical protein [Roseisolibacter sp. H3M3-2]|uniref:hypothetical protein n=1 Tax=Roseisolibacter sp. H3M3-2 TaxID=3031323 RepID=UPI0023DA3547|nr:hypothetical protein [Roseisolibacter sp. H3M3-2]MDF1502304.1 hypothetical protein [Roseisolibacter sp. H3M3-2]